MAQGDDDDLWRYPGPGADWSPAIPDAGGTGLSDSAMEVAPTGPVGASPELQFTIDYPSHLSRLLIFVKWLLIIPHAFILSFYFMAVVVTTAIAWFAILITGRYPRGLWNFALGFLQWSANVNAYIDLQVDEYPPFGPGDSHPVRLQLAYPDHLSRWKLFVKWLLAIPHFVIVYFLSWVLSLVLVFAWFVILVTGHMPRGVFDVITGARRWGYRTFAYAFLMTDAYPPFDME